MSRRFLAHAVAIAFFACLILSAGTVAAQSSENQAAAQNAVNSAAASEQSAGDANAGVGAILARTTEQAAHTAETFGRKLGIGPKISFTISIILNFAGLAFFFYWLVVKLKLPQAFRDRTLAIQKGIKDAQAASAEAVRRLSDIEARLGKLDAEVADIRASAEKEAAAEEERIRQSAEEDAKKIVQGAEAEIDAIARNARRELKGYAASLAVDLAAREIHVDEPTDQALVRDFVGQLGKDGQ